MYYDEDDFEEVSTAYMVPLEVTDGHYVIKKSNKHLIIVKSEIQGEGAYADKDTEIAYTTEAPADASEEMAAVDASGNPVPNSVWAQLVKHNSDTDGDGYYDGRVFNKAKNSWTNQELCDYVTNEGGSQNIEDKYLWILSDPSKYKGFRIDDTPITTENGVSIGKGWYFALLNNYANAGAGARIIWLDDSQATAIFGVKAETDVQDGAIYTLQGIRVTAPKTGGIYLQNGKKFIAK